MGTEFCILNAMRAARFGANSKLRLLEIPDSRVTDSSTIGIAAHLRSIRINSNLLDRRLFVPKYQASHLEIVC